MAMTMVDTSSTNLTTGPSSRTRPISPSSLPSSLASTSTSTSTSTSSQDDDDDVDGVSPVPISPPLEPSLSLSRSNVIVNMSGNTKIMPALLSSNSPIPISRKASPPQQLTDSVLSTTTNDPDVIVIKNNSNPQPFFPTIETSLPTSALSPTTYSFPSIAVNHPPTSQLRQEIINPASSSSSSSSAAAAAAARVEEYEQHQQAQRTPTISISHTGRHRSRPSVSRTPSPPTATTTISSSSAAINTPPNSSSSVSQSSSNSGNRPIRARRQSTQVFSAPSSGAASSSGGNDPANQLEAKVVILGSQGVGKTSIVHRYTTGVFSYSLTSTIGASFLAKRLIVDGCKVRLQIWDTAGQERFRSMAPLYYRGALAAILVYDITNEDSFLDIRLWMEELRRNMAPDLVIHVVGSKLDLVGKRQVKLIDAQRTIAQWADELDRAEEERLHGPIASAARERDAASPSPSRSRANTRTRRGSIPGPPSTMPSMFTPAAPTPASTQVTQDSLARVRKMSTKLGNVPVVATMAAAATTNSLGGNTSSASSTSEALGVTSEGMSRSGSKMSLSLGSLGLAGRTKSRNEDDERKAAEDAEKDEIARIDRLVKECAIEVSEVSAKDDIGVEEMFVHITQRLVERKTQIETARILRSRDSIMLRDDAPAEVASGWCCA